jgi:hypothetical protein
MIIACVATGSIAAGIFLVMLTAGSHDYKPVRITIHDSSLVLRRFVVTQGTNHTIFRGNPLLGRLNRSLTQLGLRCIGDARQLTKTTSKNTSVLCIGYTCPSTSPGLVPGNVATLFTDSHGDTVLFLEVHTLMLDPKKNSCLTIWTLPARWTNYAGCELHLVTKPDNKKLVSFKL